MPMQWLYMLIVAAAALLFWGLSRQREKRLYAYTDPFARAFCEAADHVISNVDETAELNVRKLDGGYLEALPSGEQPEAIQKLFERGVDAYIMDRMRAMYALRDSAQSLLTSVNLISGKYNAPMNHCYDLANHFFSFVDDPKKLKTEADLKAFSDFLHKQRFLRNTTLAAIVSDACKREISVP